MPKSFPFVALLAGDPFLCDEKFKSLLESLKKKIPGEIGVSISRLSEVPVENILAEARSLPFWVGAQVFRIRSAELLKEKQQAVVFHYLKSPAEGSYLVFETESLEEDDPFAVLIRQYGEVFIFDKKQRRESAGQFIREKLKRFGKTIHPHAVSRLREGMAEAPGLLNSVLEQLASYAGDREEIDEVMVEKFEEKWEESDVFQLANALGARQTEQALQSLHQILLQAETDSLSLIGFLHWQIRRWWKAHLLMERGESQEVVLKKCKVYPRQAPFFLRQLKQFPREDLEKALEALFRLDWRIKTGQVEPYPGLETWVMEISRTAAKV